MLKEVDQNPHTMGSKSNPLDEPRRSHMAIHQTNLFRPHKCVITHISLSPNKLHLVARRGHVHQENIMHPFSQLDIYNISLKHKINQVLTIFEYENITGLAWLDETRFLSVSQQATINIYSAALGAKMSTYTSDYGPITCLRCILSNGLLVTGTEHGYAVAYKIDPEIECVSKMVKLNEPIKAIDVHVQPKGSSSTKVAPKEVSKKVSKATKPGKRKRAESSGESEDEDEDDNGDVDSASKSQFLGDLNVLIYGACPNKVVAWDYHRKAILDTVLCENEVCSLMVARNGDFVIGDSKGYMNIHDKNTFTCRQSEQVLKSSITCLARDPKNTIMVAAGKESTIALLKPKASSDSSNEYMLFEKIREQSGQVEAVICSSKREFFACSHENTMVKFRLNKPKRPRELKRFVVWPNNRPKIHWALNELMFIYGKTLYVHKVDPDSQFRTEAVTYPTRHSLAAPHRTCSVKPALIIHSATFNENWICYATNQGTTIIDRPGLSRLGVPSENMNACQMLKLCQSGRYLVSARLKTVSMTRLDESAVCADSNDASSVACKSDDGERIKAGSSTRQVYKTVMARDMKGYIRYILFHESSNLMLVVSGFNSLSLVVFEFPSELPEIRDNRGAFLKDGGIKILYKASIKSDPAAHLAFNQSDKSDTNLYVYTSKNQLAKFDILNKESFNEDSYKAQEVTGLAKYTSIQGITVLCRRYALLYDSNYLFKMDIDTNEIVNTTPKYDKINVVCDTIFNEPDEILIV